MIPLEIPQAVMDREFPPDAYPALPSKTRELLVRLHLLNNYGKGLEHYPLARPKGGLPSTTLDTLCHVAWGLRKANCPPAEIARKFGINPGYVAALVKAIRYLDGMGVEVQTTRHDKH